MTDYADGVTEEAAVEGGRLLDEMETALGALSALLGAWWYVTPSASYNREHALAAWEARQEATLITNGREYGVLLEVWSIPAGWHQTSPEELEAD